MWFWCTWEYWSIHVRITRNSILHAYDICSMFKFSTTHYISKVIPSRRYILKRQQYGTTCISLKVFSDWFVTKRKEFLPIRHRFMTTCLLLFSSKSSRYKTLSSQVRDSVARVIWGTKRIINLSTNYIKHCSYVSEPSGDSSIQH